MQADDLRGGVLVIMGLFGKGNGGQGSNASKGGKGSGVVGFQRVTTGAHNIPTAGDTPNYPSWMDKNSKRCKRCGDGMFAQAVPTPLCPTCHPNAPTAAPSSAVEVDTEAAEAKYNKYLQIMEALRTERATPTVEPTPEYLAVVSKHRNTIRNMEEETGTLPEPTLQALKDRVQERLMQIDTALMKYPTFLQNEVLPALDAYPPEDEWEGSWNKSRNGYDTIMDLSTRIITKSNCPDNERYRGHMYEKCKFHIGESSMPESMKTELLTKTKSLYQESRDIADFERDELFRLYDSIDYAQRSAH